MQVSASVDLSGSAYIWVYTCAICIICMYAGFRYRQKTPQTV